MSRTFLPSSIFDLFTPVSIGYCIFLTIFVTSRHSICIHYALRKKKADHLTERLSEQNFRPRGLNSYILRPMIISRVITRNLAGFPSLNRVFVKLKDIYGFCKGNTPEQTKICCIHYLTDLHV